MIRNWLDWVTQAFSAAGASPMIGARLGPILEHQTRHATVEEPDIATLERRIADELHRNDALLLPPTVVGAWGRRSNGR